MWNKILHQEEDLDQYVLQKLLHEAGPEHQSVGQRPDQCSLEPQALGLAELEKGWVC